MTFKDHRTQRNPPTLPTITKYSLDQGLLGLPAKARMNRAVGLASVSRLRVPMA